MYDFKEIEIYQPKSKITSTWKINEKCSEITKKKLNYFLEQCDELEMILTNANCNLLDFFWYASDDDDIYLSIEIDRKDHDNFKSIVKNLKVFFSHNLICKNEDTTFLDFDCDGQTRSSSYVSSWENKLTVQISLDWKHCEAYIPTPDYFYASMW